MSILSPIVIFLCTFMVFFLKPNYSGVTKERQIAICDIKSERKKSAAYKWSLNCSGFHPFADLFLFCHKTTRQFNHKGVANVSNFKSIAWHPEAIINKLVLFSQTYRSLGENLNQLEANVEQMATSSACCRGNRCCIFCRGPRKTDGFA